MVGVEGRGLDEALPTHVTHMWPLAGVDHFVPLQVAAEREALRAEFALVGFFFGV